MNITNEIEVVVTEQHWGFSNGRMSLRGIEIPAVVAERLAQEGVLEELESSEMPIKHPALVKAIREMGHQIGLRRRYQFTHIHKRSVECGIIYSIVRVPKGRHFRINYAPDQGEFVEVHYDRSRTLDSYPNRYTCADCDATEWFVAD